MRTRSLWHSFQCALAGLWYAVRSGRNVRIQIVIAVVVVSLAAFLKLTLSDWAILALTIGMVIAAEMGNTVVETIIDLVSPEYHELAKVAKDVVAGAVLCLALASVAVGLLILGPPLAAAWLFG